MAKGVTAGVTPVQSKKAWGASKEKKKKNQGGKDTLPTDNTKAKTPTSVGSDMKFLPNERLEKYSQDTAKKLTNQPCADLEHWERKARNIVENNSVLIHVKVRNGMWPWLSEVGLSPEGNILFCRNAMNHNSISATLSNKITYNFLDNPIDADLRGKVHTKDMVTNMICILTHNKELSVNTTLKNFYNF